MSPHRVVTVLDDSAALSEAAARHVAQSIGSGASSGRRFSLAMSGGRTPWLMVEALRRFDLPWHLVDVFQVDERVAPAGDPARNLSNLQRLLPPEASIHPMPVEASELEAAAASYASVLPAHFDLVHLGLGPDGHTASLVPGDPVLDVVDRDVALTQVYQGHQRMTLTFPALARAHQVMWLVSGADKAPALRALLADDVSIPAARIAVEDQVVLCDQAAAEGLPTG